MLNVCRLGNICKIRYSSLFEANLLVSFNFILICSFLLFCLNFRYFSSCTAGSPRDGGRGGPGSAVGSGPPGQPTKGGRGRGGSTAAARTASPHPSDPDIGPNKSTESSWCFT